MIQLIHKTFSLDIFNLWVDACAIIEEDRKSDPTVYSEIEKERVAQVTTYLKKTLPDSRK